MADFLAVALVNGYVTVAVSLGGRTTSFHLRNGRRLDDGAWHHVEIKRMKKVRHSVGKYLREALSNYRFFPAGDESTSVCLWNSSKHPLRNALLF